MVERLTPFEILEEFEIIPGKTEKGFFIKSFLADDTVNKNLWKITKESLKRDIHTYLETRFSPVGKTMPFFLELDPNHEEFMDHPKSTETESVFITQERRRVGDMIAVGLDDTETRAWQVSRIDDLQAQEAFRKGQVLYVSPGLRSLEEHDENGIAVVTRFIGEHIAGVNDPAYGIEKSKIVGTCNADTKECIEFFKDVQASNKDASTWQKEAQEIAKGVKIGRCSATGKLLIELEASNDDGCISQILSKKMDSGQKPTTEDLVSAFTQCSNLNKNSSKTASITSLNNTSNTQNSKMTTITEEQLKEKEAKLAKRAEDLDQREKELKDASKKATDDEKKDDDVDKKSKKAQTVSPDEDGKCPSGFTKGEDGMCHLQSNDQSAKVASLQTDVRELKATIDNKIKKPIAEKIASVQMELGTLDHTEFDSRVSDLLRKPLSELETTQSDYVAMYDHQSEMQTPEENRYEYSYDDKSASSNEKSQQQVLAKIRGRMGSQ